MQPLTSPTVPNPDPTARTIETLQRDIELAREIIEATNKGIKEVIETRLSGMDKAIMLLQESTDRIPTHVREEVEQLRELHSEKFASVEHRTEIQFSGIATQFSERDKRMEQLSLADKTAINAALAAQEKQAVAQNESNAAANAKMEANFAKLIDQGQALTMEVRRNNDMQINDIKSRMDKGEGRSGGAQYMLATLISIVVAGVAITGLIMTLALK